MIALRLLAATLLLASIHAQAADPVPSAADQQDHEQLRALLATFTQAFNSRNLDPMLPHLHPNFTITMVDQDVVTNPGELKSYLEKQFAGPNPLIKDVKIKPEADVLTVFVNGKLGINRGTTTRSPTDASSRSIRAGRARPSRKAIRGRSSTPTSG